MTNIDLTKDPIMMDMRESIDRYDNSFLHLLAERMRVAKKIMQVKLDRKIDITPSNARQKDMKQLSTELVVKHIFLLSTTLKP